jgi:TetR/AcrR family transcriptional repressor of nem operon
MRYQPGHKEKIHNAIVSDASQRFRSEGISGPGVASVMRDAGLTHGGFYKHFKNKNELLVEATADAFRDMGARLLHAAGEAAPVEAWRAIVTEYLSPNHCDHPETGCPLAALAPELARTNRSLKKRISAGMRAYKDMLVPFMPGGSVAERERAFFVIFSTMIGSIGIARMISDPDTREQILTNTRNFLLGCQFDETRDPSESPKTGAGAGSRC